MNKKLKETYSSIKNYYEDKELFKIRNWQDNSERRYIGKENVPIVIFDDFYVNPDAVREFTLNSVPYSKALFKNQASPGVRCLLPVEWEVTTIAKNIFQSWYRTELNIDYKFGRQVPSCFTIIDTSETMEALQCFPHIDIDYNGKEHLGDPSTAHVALIVYLNKPEECKGGTAIYHNKIIDSCLVTSKEQHQEYEGAQKPVEHMSKRKTNINTTKNNNWEVIDTIDMKYNRAVFYPTCLFHHPLWRNNWFTNPNYRLTQLGFI
jgi:hypothetical protein